MFTDICKSWLSFNSNSDYLLSSYCVPGIEIFYISLHLLHHLILSHSLKSYYYPHFIVKNTKALENLVPAQPLSSNNRIKNSKVGSERS